MNVYLGRQPILDASSKIFGYELLYRSHDQLNQAVFNDGDQATTQVILNIFTEMGAVNLTGGNPAFINLTRNFISGKLPIPFPAHQVYIEILENTPDDPEVIQSLKNLSAQGYKLALDDVTDVNRLVNYLPVIDVAKVDIRAVQMRELKHLILPAQKKNVALLAEKVETYEEFQHCRDLGFHYFQGYFFCKPNLIQKKRMNTSQLTVIQTLAELQNPNVRYEKLEAIISKDVFMTYKLLLLVNSGYYGLQNVVKSVRHALTIVGLDTLRGWMSLLMLNRMSNKPHELTTIALMRARMAEEIGKFLKVKMPEMYYLTGLFSVLDAYMDIPMDQIVNDIPISPEVCSALVSRSGPLGTVLNAITDYEAGKLESSVNLGLTAGVMNQIFTEAITYSNLLYSAVL